MHELVPDDNNHVVHDVNSFQHYGESMVACTDDPQVWLHCVAIVQYILISES